MNNGVRNANYFLKGKVGFVEHPGCRVDNERYDDDGVHFNKSLGPSAPERFFKCHER